MGGIFPFFGFNLIFWVGVGFVRFITERAFTTLGIAPAIEALKRSAKRHLRLIEEMFGVVGVVVGSLTSFLCFVVFTSATDILDGSLLDSQAFVSSSVFSWAFFSFLAGYAASRIEKHRPLMSAFLSGVLFSLMRAVTIFALGVPGTLFATVAGALLVLLALSCVFSLVGGYFGALMNVEDRRREERLQTALRGRIKVFEVAAIVPAHNEEKTIGKTIESLKKILPSIHIYIGSDASTDRTVEIAESLGVVAADIQPNRGKANVLAYLIDEYKLCDRYEAVMIVDADSEVEGDYLENALPLFDDPDVAAVAVHAMSKWNDKDVFSIPSLIASYRVRFYRFLQATLRYGQTWKYTSVSPIVPGFASIYRTRALRHITVNAPGLVIEDFNMTFELYHKKLGRVAYSPKVHGISRDPLTIKDYYKQVKRWNLGLWQTVRRHGIWGSFFCFSLYLFLAEMLLTSLFTVLMPFFLAGLAFYWGEAIRIPLLFGFSLAHVTLFGIGIFFLLDYLMTAAVAFYEKKYMLLLNGFAFILFRYIDALTFLYTLPLAFFAKSDGKWVSPVR